MERVCKKENAREARQERHGKRGEAREQMERDREIVSALTIAAVPGSAAPKHRTSTTPNKVKPP
jgi:hypothetical protein